MNLSETSSRSFDAVLCDLDNVIRFYDLTPLVLVTNVTVDLERDLESMGLADLADHVVSSARVGVAKPDRAIYEIAAERAGVAARRCLFVDDRLENVEAAVVLGMTGVHYRITADLQQVLGFLPDLERSRVPSEPTWWKSGTACSEPADVEEELGSPYRRPPPTAPRG